MNLLNGDDILLFSVTQKTPQMYFMMHLFLRQLKGMAAFVVAGFRMIRLM